MNLTLIKREIERAVESKKSDIERLEGMAAVIEEYEESGWNPDVYKDFVGELRKLGMCVVHRNTLLDMQTIISALDRASLPRQDPDGMDDEDLNVDRVERVESAIEQSFRMLL